VHARHSHIDQEGINLKGIGERNSTLTALSLNDVMSVGLEEQMQGFSYPHIIIDDQNFASHSAVKCISDAGPPDRLLLRPPQKGRNFQVRDGRSSFARRA